MLISLLITDTVIRKISIVSPFFQNFSGISSRDEIVICTNKCQGIKVQGVFLISLGWHDQVLSGFRCAFFEVDRRPPALAAIRGPVIHIQSIVR